MSVYVRSCAAFEKVLEGVVEPRIFEGKAQRLRLAWEDFLPFEKKSLAHFAEKRLDGEARCGEKRGAP